MSSLKMWRGHGEETRDTDAAMIVYMADGDAMEEFLALARENRDFYVEGIAAKAPALYMWSYKEKRYIECDLDMLYGLREALNLIFAEERSAV